MDLINSTELFHHSMDTHTCGGYQPDLKAGMHRARLNSIASTVAPNSAALSFAPSPAMSPEICSESAEPLFCFDFMLPAAEKSSDEEMPEEPVSRVSSPVHKVPRLGGQCEPAPTTPRAAAESPRTPPSCMREAPCRFTPPPLIPKSKIARPRLLQALQMKSLEQVRAVLQANPEDASEPFWDHDCEPPLCCAVRLECDTSIVKLLLEHKADPDAADKRGRTPLQLLQQTSVSQTNELVWNPTMFPNAHFLPALPHEFGGMPFGALPSHASTTEAWRQEVADLLSGGN